MAGRSPGGAGGLAALDLDVTKSTVGTADEQTQASWQVTDIRAEVAELRARRLDRVHRPPR
jgi:hypothetical protein